MISEFGVVYYKGNANEYKLSKVVNEYIKMHLYTVMQSFWIQGLDLQSNKEKLLKSESSLFQISGGGVIKRSKKSWE